MEMCRACLSVEKPVIPLDKTFIDDYNLLTNLNITINDGLPQFICHNCSDAVRLFILFRQKSHTSESTLREFLGSEIKSEVAHTDILNYDHHKSESDSVKHEVKFEYEIDESISNEQEFYNVNDQDDGDINLLCEKKETEPKSKNLKYMKPRISKKMGKQNNSRKYAIKLKKFDLDCTIKQEIARNHFLCGLCNMSCHEKNDLTMHLETHKDSRLCEQCPERFDSWSQQLSHRLKHIPQNQKHCHLCSKRYMKSYYLEFHYRNVHYEEEGKNIKCKVCLSTFSSPRNLTKHIWALHAEKKYVCDYCSKSYHSKSALRVHIATHTGNRAYACDICGFKSKFYSGLKDHQIRRHAIGKVTCRLCCRAFSNQHQLDKHKCNIHKIVCPTCGLQFNNNVKLARHLKTHSDVRKYECTRCPAKFKGKSALNDHQDKHDGIRRWQCEYCSSKFSANSTLIKHRRIHTGERPYVCKICSKGFTGNNNLKVHMKVHGEHNLIKKRNKDPECTEVNSMG